MRVYTSVWDWLIIRIVNYLKIFFILVWLVVLEGRFVLVSVSVNIFKAGGWKVLEF